MATATVDPEPSTIREVNGSGPDHIAKQPGLAHTTTNISMTPELFEKLYLAPKIPHAVDHAARFANATPLGFLGFVISTFTFSMVMMGWGGASGLPAVVGIFFFTGPVLLLLSTIFLWIQSQFFPMMVCGLFCVFWLSFGMLQLPSLGLATAYEGGAMGKEMNAVIALYLLVWGFALGTFWVFTLRINAVFAGIFGFVTIGAWVLSGAYWKLSTGNVKEAQRLQKGGGALLFIVAVLGWYMIFVQMAAEMRWSVNLPVGDLSHYWRRTDVELAAMENEKKD
ncbi:plasma membrane ammonium transporter [Trematosphaeria pertusa]|uniref:Plasma membrane ammonium transporter n=1 Tax=Trematosphaeria pertusa TaxID=390896 RepID=A0A6A6HR97_9PLEO|nr:plasma membrane ammonium transporter [Trematosphaeria pertusa]KAF2240636.1 plasma membrane ammonium transporter [Trematosphaeria pertusa]